jgi:hypothetical protein
LALGHLGQKLKAQHTVEEPGEKLELLQQPVPYKVQVAIERHARLMAGYRYGSKLSEEFFTALKAGGDKAFAGLDARIATEEDPRRVEIFESLKKVLLSYAVQV